MKVLHVSTAEVYGGIETILVTLASKQTLCPGLEHHFALCFEGRLSEELRALKVPLYRLGPARISRPLSVWKARRALALAIRNSDCDIVICHGPRSMICFAPLVRASRLPLVMWAHGVRRRRRWLNRLVRRVPPDLTICNSQFTQGAYTSLFPSIRSVVVYYPLEMTAPHRDETHKARLRKEFRTPDDAIVIVLASRMVSWKGHRLLIESLSDLKEDKSWQCWIVGGVQAASEAEYVQDLEEKVRAAELDDRIHFLGQQTRVPGILAASDIFCQPNERAEPFGVVFIEAMLAGLPVVTSALGAANEVVDPDSGILVPANDRHALSQALASLLSDSTLRSHFAAGGPARARELCEPATRMQDLRTALEYLTTDEVNR